MITLDCFVTRWIPEFIHIWTKLYHTVQIISASQPCCYDIFDNRATCSSEMMQMNPILAFRDAGSVLDSVRD